MIQSQRLRIFVITMTITLSLYALTASAAVIDEILTGYLQQGAPAPQADNGKQLWTKTYANNKKPQQRSCTDCHTENLRATGKHIKTGKPIEPLAPSVNKERLTDARKIEKWFKRNCKWTLGRECSVQEKADILSFLRSQ